MFTAYRTGELERCLESASWQVPAHIELTKLTAQSCTQEDNLDVLTWTGLGRRPPAVTAEAGMLEEFVTLFDKPAQSILRYARRWGVLELCEEHNLPVTHKDGCAVRGGFRLPERSDQRFNDAFHEFAAIMATEAQQPSPKPWMIKKMEQVIRGDFYTPVVESISSWRKFSAAANAMLIIHAHLLCGEIAPDDAWVVLDRPAPFPKNSLRRSTFAEIRSTDFWDLLEGPPSEGPLLERPLLETPLLKTPLLERPPLWNENRQTSFPSPSPTHEADSAYLSSCLNNWLIIGGVCPYFDPFAQTISFRVLGLFSALAVELLTIIAGSEGPVICSNPKCRQFFQPQQRRPKVGQRRFCPRCRAKNIPKTMATADWRRKKAIKRSTTLGNSLGKEDKA